MPIHCVSLPLEKTLVLLTNYIVFKGGGYNRKDPFAEISESYVSLKAPSDVCTENTLLKLVFQIAKCFEVPS